MKDLIECLKKYNAWRRGEDERTMEDVGIKPKELGEKIDEAIKWLELMSKHSDLAELKKLAARQVAYEDASDITDAIHEIAALRCYRENHTELMERLRTMHRERHKHDAEVIEQFTAGIIQCIKALDPNIGKHKNCLSISELKAFNIHARNAGVSAIKNYANQLRQKAKDESK